MFFFIYIYVFLYITEFNLKVENALLNWKQKNFFKALRTVLGFMLITHKTETVLNLHQWDRLYFQLPPNVW